MSMHGRRSGSSKPLDWCIEAQVLIEGFQANLPVGTYQVTWGYQSTCQSVENTGNEASGGFCPGSNEGQTQSWNVLHRQFTMVHGLGEIGHDVAGLGCCCLMPSLSLDPLLDTIDED